MSAFRRSDAAVGASVVVACVDITAATMNAPPVGAKAPTSSMIAFGTSDARSSLAASARWQAELPDRTESVVGKESTPCLGA